MILIQFLSRLHEKQIADSTEMDYVFKQHIIVIPVHPSKSRIESFFVRIIVFEQQKQKNAIAINQCQILV
jgi:hypothetical protein